jgi:hypothetical protein
MSKAVGFGLLASAFAPMVALLAVLRLPGLGRAGVAILVVCGLALLLLWLVLRQVGHLQSRTIETTSVRRADERVLAFASSYVVPAVVAVFGRSSVPTLVGTSALVVFLALIYVRSGLYHLNPTLAILGFRLYEVTAANGTVTMLLTRERHIPQAGELVCRYLGDHVAIQIGGDR